MRSVLSLLLLVCLLPISSVAKPSPPEEIHLLLPYPEGKADSVLTAKNPLVFIPQAELTALEAAAEARVPKLPKPPVAGTISYVSISGKVEGDAARLSVTYVVDLLEEGPVYIPLASQSTPILSAIQSGRQLPLTAGGTTCQAGGDQHTGSGHFWGAVTEGAGRKELKVQMLIPIRRSDGSGSMEILLPPAGTSFLSLSLPPGDWQAESSSGEVSVVETSEGQRIEVHPGRGGNVRLAWRPTVRKIERIKEPAKTARIEATSENLISLGEAALKGNINFDIRIWAGQAQLLKIAVPEKVEVMRITGSNVDCWEQDDSEISVYLAAPVQGEERLSLEYLITLPGPSGVISVPAFVLGGARRQNANWAVVATTNIEVELEEHEGIELLQPRELPQALRGSIPGRILLAFRGDPSKANATLRVSRHADVPVLVAAVDQASLSTVIYDSGDQVTTCTYHVRNTTKQFLELELPSDARLWHVRVDHQPVRPGMVNGKVLLPLASSIGRLQEKAFPVELTFIVSGGAPGLVGRMSIEAPSPDLPCSRLNWTIYYPPKLQPLRWAGNLEIEELEPSPGARAILSKKKAIETTGDYSTKQNLDNLRSLGEITPPPAFAPQEETDAMKESLLGKRERLRQEDEEQGSLHVRGGRVDQKDAAQQTSNEFYQFLKRQGKRTRRTVGKPSVQVNAPTIGKIVRFKQILQQKETPSVSCWYVRSGVRWELVLASVAALFLLLFLVRIRLRGALVLLLLLGSSAPASTEQGLPREVLRMVPEAELPGLLTGKSAEEQAFVSYSRIKELLNKLNLPIRFFTPPSYLYIDNLKIVLEVGGFEARATGTGTVVSVGKGWRQLNLLRQPARPGRILVSNKPATLWTDGRITKLLFEDEGAEKLEIEYFVPVSSDGNSRSVVLPVPPASGVDFIVKLPKGSSGLRIEGQRVDLEDKEGMLAASYPHAGRKDISLAWRYVSPELALPSAVRPEEDEHLRGRLLAEGQTLFSVDAGAIEGHTHLAVDIIQGTLDSLTFFVSSQVEVLEVLSPSIEDWVLADEQDGQRLLLLLLKPGSRGRHLVDLIYEIPLSDSLTTVTLSEPALLDAVRFRGQIGIQVLSSLRVTPREQTKATRTDPRDLPSTVWNMATNPILLAFKNIDPSYGINLRLEQQEDIPLLTASVDREELLSVVSPAGHAVHRARLFVRNSGEQFLRASLPESARIWSYMVDGKTFAPSKGKDGSYRLPVPASAENNGILSPIVVELVWGENISVSRFGDKITICGPGLEIPCSAVEWELYLPEKRRWLRPKGNLNHGPLPGLLPMSFSRSETTSRTLNVLSQMNIEDMPAGGAGEGWEAGAMPVKVNIPLEGKRICLTKAMLLGEAPRVELWVTPFLPRPVVAAVGILLIILTWRFLRRFSLKGWLLGIVITAIVTVITDPLAILGVPIGLIWRGLGRKTADPVV